MTLLDSRAREVVIFTGLILFVFLGALRAADPKIVLPPKDAVPVPLTLYNFDHDMPGKPPPHFSLVVDGQGPKIHWAVKPDPHAPSPPNVLVQDGHAEPGKNFALALLDGVKLQNGEAAVRFRIAAGEERQDAGIVWRYQDAKNYYVVCVSGKDDDCSVYRVRKGKRKLISSNLAIIIPYTWHELRIIFVNDHYTALFNGELVAGDKDSGLREAGQVGLWTQSDSAIQFDDFRVSK